MNFEAILLSFIKLLYNIFQRPTLTPSFYRSFIARFAPFCLSQQRRYGKHLQRMPDNAAARASYDARRLPLSSSLLSGSLSVKTVYCD